MGIFSVCVSRLSVCLRVKLFEAYLKILDSVHFKNEIISEIRLGHWAPGARLSRAPAAEPLALLGSWSAVDPVVRRPPAARAAPGKWAAGCCYRLHTRPARGTRRG